MELIRNDSASAISSLQMDYGDSDEEENDSRNNSRINPEEVIVTNEELSTHDLNSRDTIHPEQAFHMADVNNDREKGLNNDPSEYQIDIDEKSDDKRGLEISPVELISDDEDGHHSHKRNQHPHSPVVSDDIRKQAVNEAINTDSPSSQGSLRPGKKATRLVSYGPDEDVDENSTSEDEEIDDNQEPSDSASPELTSTDASILSRSVLNMASDDIKIPPEPPGPCSVQLQKTIKDYYERMRREGLDMNRAIQSKKTFRNPSIYDKLIDFCHIDEKGTNFPPEIYDPHIWGKESFYDELDKIQRKDMERREKEKKERTKIEFLTGTKKPASVDGSLGPSDEKKRKTKWDAQPAGMIHVSKIPSASQNPGVVNLTAMATGTKATIIPAVGSLSKKPSSGK